MKKPQLFLTCEHGGNQIPAEYNHCFVSAGEVLNTHRGIDKGALQLFKMMEQELKPAFAISSEVCRLVVDLNRSLHRRSLFSEFTKPLPKETKAEILGRYYFPFRQAFIDALKQQVEQGQPVLHLSVHSFTPVLNGVVRTTDIGILYHPGRPWGKEFAARWKVAINKHLPHLRVRFNYPYLGKPDGHVAFHRKMYDNQWYAGIELEVNQKYAFNEEVNRGIVESLKEIWIR